MKSMMLNAVFLTLILASVPGGAQTEPDAGPVTPPTDTGTVASSEPSIGASASPPPVAPTAGATSAEVSNASDTQAMEHAEVLVELGIADGSQYAASSTSPERAASPSESDVYTEGLQRLRADFTKARELFGERHVSLFPMFYAGRGCEDKSNALFASEKCPTMSQSGLAGVIFIPLLGAGGGHGADWWPVLNTEDEGQAFKTFEDRVDRLLTAMESLASKGSVNETHYQLLAAVVKDIVNRDVVQQSYSSEESETLEKELNETTSSATTRSACDPKCRLSELKTLWEKYRLRSKGDLYKRRHNFLLGPSYGLPLTEDVTRVYLLGVTAEVGGSAWGVSANAGLRYQFDAGFPIKDAQGWYVGLGLSGELTDDLLDLFNGATTAAAKLKGASNSL